MRAANNQEAGAEKRRSRKKVKNKKEEASSTSAGNDVPFLPENLNLEIVTRLPTKDICRFKCVSKSINHLILSNLNFIHSAHNNSSSAPLILVFNCNYNRQAFLLDKCWDSKRTNAKIVKNIRLYPEYIMKLSHDGLIVSEKNKNPGDFIIFNPIFSHIVQITVPAQPRGEIFGVFYQTSRNQYCTLWAFSGPGSTVEYKLLDLGSQDITNNFRDITNPCTKNRRISDILPVLVNEFLYWVVEVDKENVDSTCVMKFDTRKELFELIPCPPGSARKFTQYENMNLLLSNGALLLVQVNTKTIFEIKIDIWKLDDRADMISTVVKSDHFKDIRWPQAVAYWNGELVVKSSFGDLFVCNLKLATARKFGREHRSTSFAPHVMSTASLEDCCPNIRIDGV